MSVMLRHSDLQWEVSTDQPLVERLRRTAWLLRDLPASSIATFAVLSAVEHGPSPGAAICTAMQPVAPLLRGTEAAINVPLLHRLVDEGLLAIWYEGPAPARKGRKYGLTAHGARVLADLCGRMRALGQQALQAAAADLDTLLSA